MEKFSKFIIEDDKLIMMKVTFHKDIVVDKDKVNGGGWFRYDAEAKMFILFGDSHDYKKATLENITKCVEAGKVFSDNKLYRNISSKYNFGYDTGTEIIVLETPGNKLAKNLESIGEKFAEINKHIEAGEEIPAELTKNFIIFPLCDDPYKDIE